MRVALTALALAAALPAAAREVTDADRAEVARIVAEFTEVAEIGDLPGLVAFIPPSIVSFLAEANGIEEETFLTMMAEGMMQAMEGVTVESFEMDLDASEVGETSVGRPYITIPTASVMTLEEGGTVTATSVTLALEDGDDWHLTRIDDAGQIAILREIYPDFADIDFPEGTMELTE